MYSPMLFQTPQDEDQPEDGDNPISKIAVIKELMRENSNLVSPKSKEKKRKGEIIEVHGGRIIHPTGKKDRHSKVCTARGPRDRRVRLSPRTAIQFYDVQDRLGYDRPSKAIDWLIKEAKSAIDALDKQPLFAANASVNIQKHDYLTTENPVFGFGFLLDGSASSFPTDLNRNEAQENMTLHPGYQQESYSALTTWNCAGKNSGSGGPTYSSINFPPVHFPAEPIFSYSQMSSHREPLQSSIINYSPISTQSSGFDFSNELSNIAAAAILTEDGKDMSIFRRQFSAAPFLQYEG